MEVFAGYFFERESRSKTYCMVVTLVEMAGQPFETTMTSRVL